MAASRRVRRFSACGCSLPGIHRSNALRCQAAGLGVDAGSCPLVVATWERHRVERLGVTHESLLSPRGECAAPLWCTGLEPQLSRPRLAHGRRSARCSALHHCQSATCRTGDTARGLSVLGRHLALRHICRRSAPGRDRFLVVPVAPGCAPTSGCIDRRSGQLPALDQEPDGAPESKPVSATPFQPCCSQQRCAPAVVPRPAGFVCQPCGRTCPKG